MSVKIWMKKGDEESIDTCFDLTDASEDLSGFAKAYRVTAQQNIDREFVEPGLYRPKRGVCITVKFDRVGPIHKPFWIQRVRAEGRNILTLQRALRDLLAGKIEPTQPWGTTTAEIRERFDIKDGQPLSDRDF